MIKFKPVENGKSLFSFIAQRSLRRSMPLCDELGAKRLTAGKPQGSEPAPLQGEGASPSRAAP